MRTTLQPVFPRSASIAKPREVRASSGGVSTPIKRFGSAIENNVCVAPSCRPSKSSCSESTRCCEVRSPARLSTMFYAATTCDDASPKAVEVAPTPAAGRSMSVAIILRSPSSH
jgi:hypothetical protein